MPGSLTTLILPGVGNSGPEHWQSRWLALHPDFQRVLQDGWDRPDLDTWCRNLEAAVHDAPSPVVLVAHSLGCLLAVHWEQRTSLLVRGALLVAPPDPASTAFPPEDAGFGPVPMHRLPFPTRKLDRPKSRPVRLWALYSGQDSTKASPLQPAPIAI